MKKLGMLLMLLLAILIGSHRVFAQSVTITLTPGWNWISCPMMDTLDFATAFGDFTPMQGDIIKSQWGNAIYRADGRWWGSVSKFYPGYGYHYKSNRQAPAMLTFNAQPPAPQVIVTTLEPTDITTNSATCGGNVASSDGNYVFVILRGICWSTNPNPTFNDNYIEAGNGLGSFTISMIELTPGITYYVRAYAVTLDGTYYGEQKTFVISQAGVWVDLGLPSGTLWATCNVGADAPEEAGDYFAWGETQPKSVYDIDTYNYGYRDENYHIHIIKYNPSNDYFGPVDNLTILLPSDDAATVNWGGGARTPTKEDWQELENNCYTQWRSQNGVYGLRCTGPNGNMLFLPAARYNLVNSSDSMGLYMTSSLTDDPILDFYFRFNKYQGSVQVTNDGNYRYLSRVVRPVRSAK